MVFDRYIVLIGGCQYGHVIGPDGSVQPVYGKPFRHYPDRDCFSDVFVYDTKHGKFGTATPLPLNDCRPMIVTAGNHIHLIGGETFGAGDRRRAVRPPSRSLPGRHDSSNRPLIPKSL